MRLPLLVVASLVFASSCGPADRPFCDARLPLPELSACSGCGPTVRERIVSPDRARSFRLAFVAEGYPKDELPRFEAQTRAWLNAFTERMDREVPGLTPMLNVSWVDFRDLAPADGFVLGACAAQTRGLQLSVDAERLAQLVPDDFDVIVVVVNTSTRYRENGTLAWYGPRAVVMANALTDGDTLAHELGHALFGLNDEYLELAEPLELVSTTAATDPDLRARDVAAFFAPNVSTVPTSPKFGGATTGVEGAMGHAYGVYRFGDDCLMNDSFSPLCPVCQKAAQERVRARRSASITNPLCGIRLSPSVLTPGQFDVMVAAFDWDGVAAVQLRTPGSSGFITLPAPTTAMATQVFAGFAPPAQGDLIVEAVCVDRRGQQTESRLQLTR